MSATGSLLREVRIKGATVAVNGQTVRVRAPVGLLTVEEQDALRAARSEVISSLDLEQRLLRMSLSEFEVQDASIEIRVPGLDSTLWFVPRLDHIAVLVREGVGRGRIWTARELMVIADVPGGMGDSVVCLARLKLTFNAAVIRTEEQSSDPRREQRRNECRWCNGRRFWQSTLGAIVCATCHPPAAPELVAEWIEQEAAP